MTARTKKQIDTAKRQAALTVRNKSVGLKKICEWVPKERERKLRAAAKEFRGLADKQSASTTGESK